MAAADGLAPNCQPPRDSSIAVSRWHHNPYNERQDGRLFSYWIAESGLDAIYRTHSPIQTKGTLTYRRTGNLRAVQLLPSHRKIESTVRYLGLEVDDALAIAEHMDVSIIWAERTRSALLLREALGHTLARP